MTTSRAVEVRAGCEGIVPLPGRLEPWMMRLLGDPVRPERWIEEHGSPVNLIAPASMGRNASELAGAAEAAGVPLEIHFARKANKSLALVDEALRLGHGVDVASERELAQTLARGAPPERVMVTAAVKPPALVEACVASGATVVADNEDELAALADAARRAGRVGVPVAPRLAPDLPGRTPTRFGLERATWLDAVEHAWPDGPRGALEITGVHFHLDGYAAEDRVRALREALTFVDALRTRGHPPEFIDIGGGIPMRYLDDGADWSAFWRTHREGLLGRRPPLTFEGHGLGLTVHDGVIRGRPAVYPADQRPIRGEWLAGVLSAPAEGAGPGATLADALRGREIRLRCEPGRSLLDGCGMTVARVEFRKRRADGVWLVGLAMNRTQHRSATDDHLVDPILVRPPGAGVPTGAIEAYLVGAYCVERELLTWRRLRFPAGVAVGDLVAFPNSAGYLMHILESPSHQIPLARNLVVDGGADAVLDPIDREARASG